MNKSFEEYRKRVAQGESIGDMLVSLRADDLTAIEALKTIKELYRLKKRMSLSIGYFVSVILRRGKQHAYL